ncbi:MAG TPA: TrmB family transcriptional regulator sugar-binding domain-containing protein [Nitrososphaera sp.]|nr:TrmB family transcriptional regulator sugar-binding domain-containing protein [Nitrososphaera sp.]
MAQPASPENDDVKVVPDHKVSGLISDTISSVNSELACLFDSQNLKLLSNAISSNQSKILELRSRGIKLSCVTEITQANIGECKEIMKHFDLFHSSNLAGSFLIADRREYIAYLVNESNSSRILRVTNASFVSSQLFLMNTISDKALPAKQRIIDIVKGLDNEFIETIRDPARTKSLVLDLIRSAIYEIAILFSTKNSFIMAERDEILDELVRASERGIKVKILVMRDEMLKEISDSKLLAPHEAIQVNYLQQFLPTKITTVIIDQSRSLTIEVNDDTKEALQDAIGLSTYSNSDSTVFSNASMFESLWIQAELDKQNKARQAYFQLFKGFKLKDEVYERRWAHERKEGDTKE